MKSVYGRPTAMWQQEANFNQPLTKVMSPAHSHEFGTGYDLQYKDLSGNVLGRLDGLRPDEAAFLKMKHGL